MYKETPRSLNIIQFKKTHSNCNIIKWKVNIIIIRPLVKNRKPTPLYITSKSKTKTYFVFALSITKLYAQNSSCIFNGKSSNLCIFCYLPYRQGRP